MTHRLVDIYVGADSTHWPIHEKLLCHHSPFFSSIFYDKTASPPRPNSTHSYGLPDEDDHPFGLLVGWLYSHSLPPASEEKHVGPLLDLYLMADKFDMSQLADEVVDAVRDFYHRTDSFPGLRRVQYIYSNTCEDNRMREMMVGSIARYLALGDKIPRHWAKALRRDGQLALDIIRSVQDWHLEGRTVPDPRDGSAERGRLANGKFSDVEGTETGEEGGSLEMDKTTATTAAETETEQTEHTEGEGEGEEGEETSVPTSVDGESYEKVQAEGEDDSSD